MSVPFLDLDAMHAELDAELDDVWHQLKQSKAFIGGPYVERFETEWADYCGVRHCVGVANGTVALQLVLQGLGIGAGDEVIVPTNTFVATAEAVVAAGAVPVFVDVDPRTLLMSARLVEAAIGPRTAAVIAVHLYGQPVDMDAIERVASAAGIAVVEDAAQAHGATWRGRRVGGFGRAGCFSFYPGKSLGAFGDAGAVVTNDFALAERIRSMSDHGRLRGTRDHHAPAGGNHRLDGLQAAVLSVKLRRLDAWIEGRRRAARAYAAALADLPIERVEDAPGAASSPHLAVIRSAHRDALRRGLDAEGIGTGVHYPVPCHRQPAFATQPTPPLPVAEEAAARVLSLPMSPHLSATQVTRVAQALERALAGLAERRQLAS